MSVFKHWCFSMLALFLFTTSYKIVGSSVAAFAKKTVRFFHKGEEASFDSLEDLTAVNPPLSRLKKQKANFFSSLPDLTGLQPHRRAKKVPRNVKILSKEEEQLLSTLNKLYVDIDPNLQDSELSSEQLTIRKLKDLYSNEDVNLKPIAPREKDKLAISKPLLSSVYSNKRLQEIADDPDIKIVEQTPYQLDPMYFNEVRNDFKGVEYRTSHNSASTAPKSPTRISLDKKRAEFMSSLSNDEDDTSSVVSQNCDTLKRLSKNVDEMFGFLRNEDSSRTVTPVEVEHRKSSLKPNNLPKQKRTSTKRVSFDEAKNLVLVTDDLMFSNKNNPNVLSFETLADICATIDPDTPEDELSKDQLFAVKLKRALDKMETQQHLKRKVRLRRKKVVISAPTQDSVEKNSKLFEILHDPLVPTINPDDMIERPSQSNISDDKKLEIQCYSPVTSFKDFFTVEIRVKNSVLPERIYAESFISTSTSSEESDAISSLPSHTKKQKYNAKLRASRDSFCLYEEHFRAPVVDFYDAVESLRATDNDFGLFSNKGILSDYETKYKNKFGFSCKADKVEINTFNETSEEGHDLSPTYVTNVIIGDTELPTWVDVNKETSALAKSIIDDSNNNLEEPNLTNMQKNNLNEAKQEDLPTQEITEVQVLKDQFHQIDIIPDTLSNIQENKTEDSKPKNLLPKTFTEEITEAQCLKEPFVETHMPDNLVTLHAYTVDVLDSPALKTSESELITNKLFCDDTNPKETESENYYSKNEGPPRSVRYAYKKVVDEIKKRYSKGEEETSSDNSDLEDDEIKMYCPANGEEKHIRRNSATSIEDNTFLDRFFNTRKPKTVIEANEAKLQSNDYNEVISEVKDADIIPEVFDSNDELFDEIDLNKSPEKSDESFSHALKDTIDFLENEKQQSFPPIQFHKRYNCSIEFEKVKELTTEFLHHEKINASSWNRFIPNTEVVKRRISRLSQKEQKFLQEVKSNNRYSRPLSDITIDDMNLIKEMKAKYLTEEEPGPEENNYLDFLQKNKEPPKIAPRPVPKPRLRRKESNLEAQAKQVNTKVTENQRVCSMTASLVNHFQNVKNDFSPKDVNAKVAVTNSSVMDGSNSSSEFDSDKFIQTTSSANVKVLISERSLASGVPTVFGGVERFYDTKHDNATESCANRPYLLSKESLNGEAKCRKGKKFFGHVHDEQSEILDVQEQGCSSRTSSKVSLEIKNKLEQRNLHTSSLYDCSNSKVNLFDLDRVSVDDFSASHSQGSATDPNAKKPNFRLSYYMETSSDDSVVSNAKQSKVTALTEQFESLTGIKMAKNKAPYLNARGVIKKKTTFADATKDHTVNSEVAPVKKESKDPSNIQTYSSEIMVCRNDLDKDDDLNVLPPLIISQEQNCLCSSNPNEKSFCNCSTNTATSCCCAGGKRKYEIPKNDLSWLNEYEKDDLIPQKLEKPKPKESFTLAPKLSKSFPKKELNSYTTINYDEIETRIRKLESSIKEKLSELRSIPLEESMAQAIVEKTQPLLDTMPDDTKDYDEIPPNPEPCGSQNDDLTLSKPKHDIKTEVSLNVIRKMSNNDSLLEEI